MPGLPLHPKNPERTCWGCDKYCPAADLACGNGTIRAPHPIELFGDDWLEWSERPNQLPSANDEGDTGDARADRAVSPRQP
jgi:hypothetical protein